ncbi:hypothetical protein cypCar_00046188 [Cyprinus carpio]|nr:hypothetical protein cypCar_00046188 [Cyprinus carpio]
MCVFFCRTSLIFIIMNSMKQRRSASCRSESL